MGGSHSLVVGKPAADVPKALTADYVRKRQIVIDVSMNWDAEKITFKGKSGMSGKQIESLYTSYITDGSGGFTAGECKS